MSTVDTRVMVVDDNPVSRYTTRRVLEHAGMRVVEAASGRQALELSSSDIDLYVLDVHLPDIHGFELCGALRALSPSNRTPILHLSAVHVTDADKIRGLEEGADAYMTHPVDPGVLVATVNAFLRTRSAEQALRLSEEKFRSIYQETPSGVGLIDDDLILSEANPALCALLGQARAQLIGARLKDCLGADAAPRLQEMDHAVRTQGSWRGELAVKRADGKTLEFDVAVSTLRVSGLRLLLATDISAQRSLEAERVRLLEGERVAREDAERANQIKDDFLATLSHELRNPLNSIVGWANVLQKTDSPEQSAEGVKAILRNANVQARLINDLLDLARITSGKMAVTLGTVDWCAAVQSSLQAFAREIEAKDLKVELDCGGASTVLVLADESRLQQIIWNLLSNAIKFSYAGGRIGVALAQDGEYASMTISDAGAGIDPELLPHIFERFRQGDSSTRRAHGGLGIGLAIVHHLVALQQGDIAASSEGRMRGASFVVRLRRADAGIAPTCAQAAPAGLDDLSGLDLLIVDDSTDAMRIMERVLRDAGARVRAVDSAAAALAAVVAQVPDVLISDIGMPGMDGYDLIRSLRRAGYSSERLPAIAVTALARENDQEEALAAGYQRHLSKPFVTHEVIRAVATLGRHGKPAARPSAATDPDAPAN